MASPYAAGLHLEAIGDSEDNMNNPLALSHGECAHSGQAVAPSTAHFRGRPKLSLNFESLGLRDGGSEVTTTGSLRLLYRGMFLLSSHVK